MQKQCKQCAAFFESRRNSQLFCSKKCASTFSNQKTSAPVICSICGKPFALTQSSVRYRVKTGRGLLICSDCIDSGPQNHTWKGGHRHWSSGRFGKDKNGLSWKAQRKLAWERDNFTCQHCHKKKSRKPDAHHIDPWMNSHSHALDNLICLCQKCHLKEEAKLHENWGGKLVEKKVSDAPYHLLKCLVCLKLKHQYRMINGVCPTCERKRKVELAKQIILTGGTLDDVVITLAVTKYQAWNWIKRKSSSNKH